MKRFFATIAVLLGVTAGLAACSSAEPVEITQDTVIIDVRTPGEFATGHLEGAINIDVQSPDFAAQVMELDKDGDYFIYCRSGNRSGQAIAQMNQMGFSDMANGGGVAEASKVSGIEVVTP